MSSIWLRIPPQPALHPWTYGDAYCMYILSYRSLNECLITCFALLDYFTLDQASPSVIVLSQTDHRYFTKLNGGDPWWLLDFLVYRKGSSEPVGMSGISLGSQRSVSCELYLQAGDYVVLVSVFLQKASYRYGV
jgi:hypothetical protein